MCVAVFVLAKIAKDKEGTSESQEDGPPEAGKVGSGPTPQGEEKPLPADMPERSKGQEEAALGKKKKKVKGKVPKVKKRPPNLSPTSEVAYFEIRRNYYDEDEAPDFKSLMQDLEDSVAEVLQ